MGTARRGSVRDKPSWRQYARWLQAFTGAARLHIVAIAALGNFTFGWLFTGHYPWLLTGICALDWYIVNLVNRVVDLGEDQANAIRGTGFIQRNVGRILVSTLILLVVSLVVINHVQPAITPLRIAGHLLGLCYNWPVLPGRQRLKQVYLLKNTASGLGFLITVFGYPLAAAFESIRIDGFPPGINWTTVAVSALFFFLFTQSYEVIYDLRDRKGDARHGIRTFPVVHGPHAAVGIADGLIIASAAVLAAGYMAGVLPWRIFIMIAAPVLQYIVYKRALRRGISSGDCRRITWMGALLLLVYHLWVLARLPGSGI